MHSCSAALSHACLGYFRPSLAYSVPGCIATYCLAFFFRQQFILNREGVAKPRGSCFLLNPFSIYFYFFRRKRKAQAKGASDPKRFNKANQPWLHGEGRAALYLNFLFEKEKGMQLRTKNKTKAGPVKNAFLYIIVKVFEPGGFFFFLQYI